MNWAHIKFLERWRFSLDCFISSIGFFILEPRGKRYAWNADDRKFKSARIKPMFDLSLKLSDGFA